MMSGREGRKGGLAPGQSNLRPWMTCGGQGRSVGCPLFTDLKILILPLKKAQPQNQQNSSPSASPGTSSSHQMPPPPPSQKHKKHSLHRRLGKKLGMFSSHLLHLHPNKSKLQQQHHQKGKTLPRCFLHQYPELNPVTTSLFQRRLLRSLTQMSLICPGLLG